MSNSTPKSTPELCSDSRAIGSELTSAAIGSVVTYDQLSSIIGHDIRTPRYRALLASARSRLLKEGVLFEAVRGQGLKRLDDSSIAKSGPGRVRKVHRVAKNETRKMLCADQSKLTNSERITHNASLSMVGAIAEVSRPKQLAALEKRISESPSRLSLEATLDAFRPSPNTYR